MYFDETPLYSEVAPNLFMGGTHDDAVINLPYRQWMPPLRPLSVNGPFRLRIKLRSFLTPSTFSKSYP